MPLEPGAPAFGDDVQESRPKGDGVEAGDAVALADGESVPVDSDNNEFAGVASDTETTVLSGTVTAAVADGVSEGDRLDGGSTTDSSTGVLATSSGGPVVALCDAGGNWHGAEKTYSVPDGYAVVHF